GRGGAGRQRSSSASAPPTSRPRDRPNPYFQTPFMAGLVLGVRRGGGTPWGPGEGGGGLTAAALPGPSGGVEKLRRNKPRRRTETVPPGKMGGRGARVVGRSRTARRLRHDPTFRKVSQGGEVAATRRACRWRLTTPFAAKFGVGRALGPLARGGGHGTMRVDF